MKKLNLTVAFMLLIVLMPSGTQSQNWIQWGNASDCLDFEGFFADSSGQNLYAKGRYLDEFGDTIHGLAKWDSTDWENIGYVSTHCSSVVQYKNLLCAANNLYGSLYVYCWDGMHWDTLGNQLGFYVNNLANSGSGTYDAFIAEFAINDINSINKINSFNDGLSIYPNPSDGLFTLNFSSFKSKKIIVQVYNSIGQLVYNQNLNENNNHSLDLRNLPNGLYIVIVNLDYTSFSKKIIKQK